MQYRQSIPVLGVAGWSGSGKTTLITRLIPLLAEKDIQIAVIKHDVHGISTDETGKDSWRFAKAGAAVYVLCGPDGPELDHAIEGISGCGLILVEGFKAADIPKIGIACHEKGIGWTAPPDSFLAAVSDVPETGLSCPWFHRNDIDGLAAWIEVHILEG